MGKKEQPKPPKPKKQPTVHGEKFSWLALFGLNRRRDKKGPYR